jgi:hypothetical protein
MKRILIVLLLGAFVTSVQAQEGSRLGVKGAFNATWLFNKNVSDKNASLDYASSFGSSFGLQFISMLSDQFGVSAEVLVSSHNQKYDGEFDDSSSFTNEVNLTYIDIPLLFRVASEKGPYFEIGPQLSLLSGAKETIDFTPGTIGDYSDKDFKDDFNSFGISGVLGFGIDISLTEKLILSPGLRFAYMFTDATTEYSAAEYNKLSDEEKLSANAAANHIEGSGNLFDPNNKFNYAKTNRATGGLHVSLSYLF